jgi:hypothetical protein
MKAFIFLVSVVTLVGCAGPKHLARPLESAEPSPKKADLVFKDQSVAAPPQYFQETAQSKAVKAGSKFYADSNYCEFIRRYRLKTNADFNSAINLFKYRAYFMGAQRVVFVESDVLAKSGGVDVEVILHPSLPPENTTSIIVGDLYECPSTKAALY